MDMFLQFPMDNKIKKIKIRDRKQKIVFYN